LVGVAKELLEEAQAIGLAYQRNKRKLKTAKDNGTFNYGRTNYSKESGRLKMRLKRGSKLLLLLPANTFLFLGIYSISCDDPAMLQMLLFNQFWAAND
jgi:hypothetical protein